MVISFEAGSEGPKSKKKLLSGERSFFKWAARDLNPEPSE